MADYLAHAHWVLMKVASKVRAQYLQCVGERQEPDLPGYVQQLLFYQFSTNSEGLRDQSRDGR